MYAMTLNVACIDFYLKQTIVYLFYYMFTIAMQRIHYHILILWSWDIIQSYPNWCKRTSRTLHIPLAVIMCTVSFRALLLWRHTMSARDIVFSIFILLIVSCSVSQLVRSMQPDVVRKTTSGSQWVIIKVNSLIHQERTGRKGWWGKSKCEPNIVVLQLCID